MYRTSLLAVGLLLSLATVGCKSDVEKYADDVCACKDKKCLEEVQAKWKDKAPKADKGDKKLEELDKKEQEALKKIIECSIEASKK